MGSRDKRHDTSIHNAQILNPINEQLVADHTAQVLRKHSRGTRSVAKGRRDATSGIERSNDLVVGLSRGAGRELKGREGGELLAGPVLPVPADHGEQDVLVDGVLQRVPLYDGVAVLVPGVEGDGAAGQGALEGGEREARGRHGELADCGVVAGVELGDDGLLGFEAGGEGFAGLVECGQEVGCLLGLELLDERLVGRGDLWEGQEGEGVAVRDGVRAGLLGLVLCPCGCVIGRVLGEGAGVGEGLVGQGVEDVGVGVVLQVRADGGEVLLDLDAGGLQNGLGTQAAELQNLRCEDGASGEDDFASGVDLVHRVIDGRHELDTGGRLAIEEDLVDPLAGDELQVLARSNGVVVCVSGVGSGLLDRVDGHGREEGTDGPTGGMLLGGRHALSAERLPDSLDIGVVEVGVPDLERPLLAVGRRVVGIAELLDQFLGGRGEGGRLLEVRKEALPAPAVVAQLLPGVIVGGRGTIGGHAINDRASSYNVADKHLESCVAKVGLGRRGDVVHALIVVGGCGLGNEGPGALVDRAVFDDEDGAFGGLGHKTNGETACVRKARDYSRPDCSLRRLATTKPVRPPPTMT